MDLQSIRNYVRVYLDVDAEDIPDQLIDRWCAEAQRRITRKTRTWPFFETTATVNTIAGTDEYALPIRDVSWVEGPDGHMPALSAAEAQIRYFSGSTVSQGRPESFSLWGEKLRVWPRPDAVYVLSVRGYRVPVDFTTLGAAAEPDLPDDFHEVLLSWVMYQAHLHQDDTELAAAAKSRFDEGLAELLRDEQTAVPHSPIVLNGGPQVGNSQLPRKLRWPNGFPA